MPRTDGAIATVLVVDDEPKIRAILAETLRSDARRVIEAGSGREALAVAERERPQLIVLDLGLPDMDGLEVCRTLRSWSSAPIVVLSARAAEEDKTSLLEAGADDYVTKPFSTAELRARVQAQLRRAQMAPLPGSDAPVTIGHLVVDTAQRTVMREGERVHLTPTEWNLLQALLAQAGRPVTHARLFREAWGNVAGDAQQYLRVYVGHLRRKLERDPYRPRLILTEPGVGYRLLLEPLEGADAPR
jgi:two-component system, OmpR family, KDP operon response regulator KdpE